MNFVYFTLMVFEERVKGRLLVVLEESVRLAAESIVAEVGAEGNSRPVILYNYGDNGSCFQKALASAGYSPKVLLGSQPSKGDCKNYEVDVDALLHSYRFGER